MFLPSPLYLLAVQNIANSGSSASSNVLAVLICAVAVLIFVECTVLALFIRPGSVAAGLEPTQRWLTQNGWTLGAIVAFAAAAYALVAGSRLAHLSDRVTACRQGLAWTWRCRRGGRGAVSRAAMTDVIEQAAAVLRSAPVAGAAMTDAIEQAAAVPRCAPVAGPGSGRTMLLAACAAPPRAHRTESGDAASARWPRKRSPRGARSANPPNGTMRAAAGSCTLG